MSLYRGRPEVSAQGQGEPFELEGTCYDLPPTSASDPQKKSISVAAIGLEMAIEELVQAVTCIVRCLAIVFHPVIKQGHAGLKVRVIESVVRAGIDNELEWRPVVAPAGDFIGAVCRRRPIVEGANEDDRGIPGRAMACLHGGLNAAAARNRKLLGGANSSNELGSAAERATQPPAEKPTAATRCGSTKVWPARKMRAP